MEDDINELLNQVREKYSALDSEKRRDSVLRHLRSIASLDEGFAEPVGVKVPKFPNRLPVAYATCECGVGEFIVEGSTQECQHCGRLMFRHQTEWYERHEI